MKRFLPLVITLALGQALQAQKMRDVFAAMPDSVLGIMTKNNRLDCIDFIENDMEAKVRNRFDGFSVLKALTVDYLDLQLTPNCRVEMKLLPAEDTLNYICVARTYSGPPFTRRIGTCCRKRSGYPFPRMPIFGKRTIRWTRRKCHACSICRTCAL